MVAVTFLDALSHNDAASAGTDVHRGTEMAALAERYVDWALADWERVLECESRFGSTAFETPAEQSNANRALYAVYQQWGAEAEQVLLRTRKLAKAGHPLEKAEALEHAFGRVQARLKWTPEKFDRAHEQIRRGEFIPLQELRNELRARLRP